MAAEYPRVRVTLELESVHTQFPFDPELDPTLAELNARGRAAIEDELTDYFGAGGSASVKITKLSVEHDLVELSEAAA